MRFISIKFTMPLEKEIEWIETRVCGRTFSFNSLSAILTSTTVKTLCSKKNTGAKENNPNVF
jgi:hypothetical protein